jgi:hypothetical protein
VLENQQLRIAIVVLMAACSCFGKFSLSATTLSDPPILLVHRSAQHTFPHLCTPFLSPPHAHRCSTLACTLTVMITSPCLPLLYWALTTWRLSAHRRTGPEACQRHIDSHIMQAEGEEGGEQGE